MQWASSSYSSNSARGPAHSGTALTKFARYAALLGTWLTGVSSQDPEWWNPMRRLTIDAACTHIDELDPSRDLYRS